METRCAKVISRETGYRRGLLIGMAISAILLFGAALRADAATDARLTGSFDATATVRTGGGPPIKVHRVYRFKPLCKKGVCTKVKFFREAGSGGVFNSILTRKARGIYKGKKSFPVTCSGSGVKGTFTEKHRVKIVRAKKGKAVKLEGQSSYRSKGRGCDVDQKASWVAKR